MAVTASPAAIVRIAAGFEDAAPADQLQVRHSRYLGERW
jgi:hypothetical protein